MSLSFRTIRNLGLCTLLFIIIGISLFSYSTIRDTGDEITGFMTAEQIKMVKWFGFLDVINDSKDYLYDFQLGRHAVVSPTMLLVNQAIESIEEIKKQTTDETELAQVDKLSKELRKYRQAVCIYIEEISGGYRDGATAREMEVISHKAAQDIVQMSLKVTDLISHNVEDRSRDIVRTTRASQRILYVVLALSVLCTVVISIVMGKALAIPIRKLAEAAKNISKGDLASRVQIDSKDEIGQLAKSFNKMADDLKNTTTSIDTLNSANQQLEASRQQLKASNQQLQVEITERKKAEQERLQLQDQVRQTQKMEAIGTLAGGIAHDFNNILGSIIGYTDLVLEGIPDGTIANANLKQVLIAGSRAKSMVKQILTFSRQDEHQKKPVEIASVVRETLSLLKSSLPATIEIKQNIEAGSSIIMADSTQIHQVIMNLCTNASDAMVDKTGVLEVCLTDIDLKSDTMYGHSKLRAGQYVKLAVKDTGHGMDSEIMERIFEPFFTTKAVDKGTGMGLSVVHGIVENHGGIISVDSEVGKGTTFNVFFPRIECDDVSEDNPSEIVAGQGEVILVVDDEKSLVDVTKQMLERSGYTVVGFTSSLDAAKAFRAEPDKFDLVITDYAMPAMTGKELAKELLEIRADIPIILCTGFSEDIDAGEANNMGIKEFVLKPVAREEITQMIRRLLDREEIVI